MDQPDPLNIVNIMKKREPFIIGPLLLCTFYFISYEVFLSPNWGWIWLSLWVLLPAYRKPGRQTRTSSETHKAVVSKVHTVGNCQAKGLLSSTYKLQRKRRGMGIYRLKETLDKPVVKKKKKMRPLGKS